MNHLHVAFNLSKVTRIEVEHYFFTWGNYCMYILEIANQWLYMGGTFSFLLVDWALFVYGKQHNKQPYKYHNRPNVDIGCSI